MQLCSMDLMALASFIPHNFLKIHPRFCIFKFVPPLCWSVIHGMDMPQFVSPFIMETHLGSFQFSAIITKAAMNICVHISAWEWVFISLGHMYKSVIAGDMAEMRQIHMDYRVLWRKRDSTDTFSRGEHPYACLDRLLLLFWAHYIEDGPHLLCTG